MEWRGAERLAPTSSAPSRPPSYGVVPSRGPSPAGNSLTGPGPWIRLWQPDSVSRYASALCQGAKGASAAKARAKE